MIVLLFSSSFSKSKSFLSKYNSFFLFHSQNNKRIKSDWYLRYILFCTIILPILFNRKRQISTVCCDVLLFPVVTKFGCMKSFFSTEKNLHCLYILLKYRCTVTSESLDSGSSWFRSPYQVNCCWYWVWTISSLFFAVFCVICDCNSSPSSVGEDKECTSFTPDEKEYLCVDILSGTCCWLHEQNYKNIMSIYRNNNIQQ